MTVNVTERQFAFEFSYPQPGRQAGRLLRRCTCPRASPVVFKLRSLDVIHSFFVPEFSEKLDAVPGITTTLRVTPTRIGTYPVECTELCGAGHSLMRSTAYVVSPPSSRRGSRPSPPTRRRRSAPRRRARSARRPGHALGRARAEPADHRRELSSSGIPQGPNAGDADGDNHGGPSDGDGNV